jgi:hypothetical protein
MTELKKIHREAIPRALERVGRYRLLNQPRVAESICHDILAIEDDNQEALIGLLLALTDQFGPEAKIGVNAVMEYVPRLAGEYAKAYYAGIVWERHAKSRLARSYPGSGFDAYDELRRALELFEKAHALSTDDDDDAILHWNACGRAIDGSKLEARPHEEASVQSE